MTLCERHDQYVPEGTPPAPPVGWSDFRVAAKRLVARGADAIARGLSRDSTAFLEANRQVGGQ